MNNISSGLFFKDQKSQTLIKNPNSIKGKSFSLENLVDCEIYILDITDEFSTTNCLNCKIYIAPVRMTFSITSSQNCTISICCSQLFVKSSTDLTFFLYCSSSPQIESSDLLNFAPYNFSYPNQQRDFSSLKFDPLKNSWFKVKDLSPSELSHFKLLPPSKFIQCEKRLEGHPDPVNPVPIPQQYGGTLKIDLKFESDIEESPRRANVRELSIIDKYDIQGIIEILYDNDYGFKVRKQGIPNIFEYNELSGKLQEFDEINKIYFPHWLELFFTGCLCLIGFFVVLLVMATIKMSSEWRLEATGLCLFTIIGSLFVMLGLVFIKSRRLRKSWKDKITEAENQQNSEYFEGKNAKITADYLKLTIHIGIH